VRRYLTEKEGLKTCGYIKIIKYKHLIWHLALAHKTTPHSWSTSDSSELQRFLQFFFHWSKLLAVFSTIWPLVDHVWNLGDDDPSPCFHLLGFDVVAFPRNDYSTFTSFEWLPFTPLLAVNTLPPVGTLARWIYSTISGMVNLHDFQCRRWYRFMDFSKLWGAVGWPIPTAIPWSTIEQESRNLVRQTNAVLLRNHQKVELKSTVSLLISSVCRSSSAIRFKRASVISHSCWVIPHQRNQSYLDHPNGFGETKAEHSHHCVCKTQSHHGDVLSRTSPS